MPPLLTSQAAIDKSIHWSLGLPGNFLITAGDRTILAMVLEAANRFREQPSDSEMAVLVEQLDIQPVFS